MPHVARLSSNALGVSRNKQPLLGLVQHPHEVLVVRHERDERGGVHLLGRCVDDGLRAGRSPCASATVARSTRTSRFAGRSWSA